MISSGSMMFDGPNEETKMRGKARYYVCWETGTDELADGPFETRSDALEFGLSEGGEEGREQGNFRIMTPSAMAGWYRRAVGV
jgi:hypothetical protein